MPAFIVIVSCTTFNNKCSFQLWQNYRVWIAFTGRRDKQYFHTLAPAPGGGEARAGGVVSAAEVGECQEGGGGPVQRQGGLTHHADDDVNQQHA